MGFGGFKCVTMKLPVPSPKGPVLFYEPPLPHWQLIDSQFSITPPTLNTLLAMTDIPPGWRLTIKGSFVALIKFPQLLRFSFPAIVISILSAIFFLILTCKIHSQLSKVYFALKAKFQRQVKIIDCEVLYFELTTTITSLPT